MLALDHHPTAVPRQVEHSAGGLNPHVVHRARGEYLDDTEETAIAVGTERLELLMTLKDEAGQLEEEVQPAAQNQAQSAVN